MNTNLTVFGHYDFAATVGLWLRYGLQPTVNLLISPFISDDGFTFTPDEYLEFRDRIAALHRKFERWPAVSNGLDDLNTGFFRHRELPESRRVITAYLDQFIAGGTSLQQAYLQAINGHARNAYFREFRLRRELEAELSAIEEEIKRIVSGNAWRQRPAFRKVRTSLSALRDQLGPLPLLPPPSLAPADLAQHVRDLRAHLRDREPALHRDRHERTANLSPATAAPDEREGLEALADRLEEWLREIDESGLYQLPLGKGAAATTSRQLSILERVLSRLHATRRHLPNLPVYYERRRFWYRQPARLRRLIGPLLDQPASLWEPAFSAWYLEACLRRAVSTGTTSPPDAADEMTETPVADDSLFFTQPYYCTEAPDWRAECADSPIPHLRVAGEGKERLLYLPDRFTAEHAAELRETWATLFSGRSRIRIYHNYGDRQITESLLRDGLTAEFLAAILVRAAEAAAADPFDPEELAGIGRELYKRLSVAVPDPHPLMLEIARSLRKRLPAVGFDVHFPYRSVFLPLLITQDGRATRLVVVPGPTPGWLREASDWKVVNVDAHAIWRDPEGSLADLAGRISAALPPSPHPASAH